MSNSIDTNSSRSMFLPGNKEKSRAKESGGVGQAQLKRNSTSRKNELDNYAKSDAKIDIPDAVKDFAKIKKVADAAPDIDNTDKIARLKSQIAEGSYKVDYDALADKILQNEF